MQSSTQTTAGTILAQLRSEPPLVQIITNYVTINDVANALLCLGGSPAMVEAEAEAASFARIVSALYLNVGTLTAEQARAMPLALAVARDRGIPVVLDPVACGAFPEKMAFVQSLLAQGGVTIIKGNSAEILSLAGMEARSRGVDALESAANPGDACRIAAEKFGAVVMATGPEDSLSDGTQVWRMTGGHPLLGRVSGTGCVLGGLVAAAAAAARRAGADDAAGCLMAAAVFALAAEQAAALPTTAGPMSFRTALFDRLSTVPQSELDAYAKIAWHMP
ncbi:MAG TPA: hydroxyethylthiazole kinase [Spirochaetota bacterium]|nr:hydroxyethylthiazole kinase [Spirochaetota bacterium]